MELLDDKKEAPPAFDAETSGLHVADGELINVSGHVQELDRTFGIWSICSIGVVSAFSASTSTSKPG